ncbi:MAG: sigma-70 family RNA polymerase sigma factor [Bacteroidetes bacterium]|nr:sigma-70 family RNA polymerase sigma factor [Bacteroidota bacterium]
MEFEKFSDAEVLSRIVKGEKELYEIIVRRYNPALYKVGRSYNYSHEDTEDLMQETFIDAYKSLNKFEGRATFKTWIIRIMMNNCYRKKEKSSFKNEINKELKDNATPMYSDAGSGADKILQNRELGAIIENALSKIPEDYRIIFSLREINGINVAETASLLTISESNVKARLSRAKAMLRNQIENSYSAAELFEFNLIYCDAIVKNVMKAINEI